MVVTSFWNVFIAGGFLYPVSSQNIFRALELNIAGAPPLFLFIASNKLATDPAASGSFKIFYNNQLSFANLATATAASCGSNPGM